VNLLFILRHNLPIRAIVLGSAVNNDGGEKQSFTSSNSKKQIVCIQKALKMADIRY
jgi:acyl transferase domain-containing protein